VRSTTAAIAVALVAAGALSGCGRAAPSRPATVSVAPVHFPPATSVLAAPVAAGASGGVAVDLSGSPTRAAPSVGVPTAIVIPAIGVRATIVSLGRNRDGSLAVPVRFDTVGWYVDTSRPGDPGPAVLAGRVDSYHGPAVFFRLKQLRPGDLLTVWSSTGAKLFRVSSVALFAKISFPTGAVFGPVPDAALRLVTCGGSFDRSTGSYRDNVVVDALEVSP
jgi:Sortase domain